MDVYPDHEGRWRWRIWAGGQVVSHSDQSFSRKWSAKRNAKRALRLLEGGIAP